jgi:hypothetical protein
MGKKPSANKQSGSSATPAGSSGKMSPLAIGGVVLVIAAVAALLLWPSGGPSQAPGAGNAATSEASAPAAAPGAQAVANAAAKAAFGPHTQASYPPIPFQGYAPPRPTEVVTAAYQFAAEHPEVASYVPCFCGCERAGHEGNTDCFVKSRAANGDVTEWDEHGLDCAVCIDVATRSRQMYASGASVRDIRAAVDKEFGPLYPGKMPTPQPPAAHATH